MPKVVSGYPTASFQGKAAIKFHMELLDKILRKENLARAYKQVVGNKGVAGIDGLQAYLKGH